MDKIDIDSLPTWDAANYLATPTLQAEYLSLVMEDGNEAEIAHALAAIERARAKAGHTNRFAERTSAAPFSNADGATTISKALSLVKALGLKLHAEPAGVS